MVTDHLTSVGKVQAKFSSLWFLLLASFIFVLFLFFLFAFLGRKTLQGEAFELKWELLKRRFSFTFIVAVYFCQSYNEGRLYIATQTPVSSTVDDFWRMVWEQRSTIVVMLSDLTDNEMVKQLYSSPPFLFLFFFNRATGNCLIWKKIVFK